jgi:hypothetical protein
MPLALIYISHHIYQILISILFSLGVLVDFIFDRTMAVIDSQQIIIIIIRKRAQKKEPKKI